MRAYTDIYTQVVIARPKDGLLRYHVKRIHFTLLGFGFLVRHICEAKLRASYYHAGMGKYRHLMSLQCPLLTCRLVLSCLDGFSVFFLIEYQCRWWWECAYLLRPGISWSQPSQRGLKGIQWLQLLGRRGETVPFSYNVGCEIMMACVGLMDAYCYFFLTILILIPHFHTDIKSIHIVNVHTT